MSDNPENMQVSTQEMLRRMEEGWAAFQTYLDTLSDHQMTAIKDQNGWTIKDHLTHLAVWEDGIVALLTGSPRHERMGLDRETLASHDYDRINAIIQSRHADKSLAQVRQMLADAHQRLVETVSRLSDADLLRPYRSYDPVSTSNDPVWPTIVGNSFGHYEEHQQWMQTLMTAHS